MPSAWPRRPRLARRRTFNRALASAAGLPTADPARASQAISSVSIRLRNATRAAGLGAWAIRSSHSPINTDRPPRTKWASSWATHGVEFVGVEALKQPRRHEHPREENPDQRGDRAAVLNPQQPWAHPGGVGSASLRAAQPRRARGTARVVGPLSSADRPDAN